MSKLICIGKTEPYYDMAADEQTWRENAEILAAEVNAEKLFEEPLSWPMASACARFHLGIEWSLEGVRR